jgi:hypothetical protein
MSKKKPRSPSPAKDPKAQLYANLARYGVWRVVITYDGCADSGCIEGIEVFGPDDAVIHMPDQQVDYTTNATTWNEKEKRFDQQRVSRTASLHDAVKSWCYDLLEEHYSGWEIDDGSSGIIELNVGSKTGTWEHSIRYTESTTHEMEV